MWHAEPDRAGTGGGAWSWLHIPPGAAAAETLQPLLSPRGGPRPRSGCQAHAPQGLDLSLPQK